MCFVSDDKSTTSAGLTTKTETLDRMLVSNDVSTKIPSDRHIRIFCWVTTTPSDIGTKAWAVYNTWMKRCDGYIFVSSKPSRQHFIPLLVLNVTDGRRHLTAKTMQSFQYIFKNHIHEFDWFLKGDDDTYVIVDNLRHFLSNKNTNDSVYFGARISNVPWAAHVREGYNAGGSGYVLSKEALRRLGEHRTNNPEICPVDGLLEDVDISFCLQKLGVKLGHTEDKYGRVRFHNYDPAFQMAKLHQYSPVTPKDVVSIFNNMECTFFLR